MKLTFEPDLLFQQQAVKSATDLFAGQPSANSIIASTAPELGNISFINSVANYLALSPEQILANLQAVQSQNGISPSQSLDGMHFSVEMETGTGKTYVYLRTIYELFTQYKFTKFVIVVPSVAIREGVLKNLQITHEHFQTLYNSVPVNYQVYDSAKVSMLRGFATNNNIEVLVINIDSFAKDENIINKPNDKLSGQKPVAFIQTTNPIVIVDEPQNMETAKRKDAIANLNPLCTLRYSATHRNHYNLVYSLNPVNAYDLGLVKQIEVDSVMEEDTYNDAFIAVDGFRSTKNTVSAIISININDKTGVKQKQITVKVGDDLYQCSNQREIYADGYIIDGIDTGDECISFSNGVLLFKGERQGGLNDEVMKFQIRKTIEEHLNKERRLTSKGIKVLSLFFIDKVANYRQYDAAGNAQAGKFAQWFTEIYQEYISKPAYKSLGKFSVDQIHNGYFSQDAKGKWKDTKETESSKNSQAAIETYNLIMKDKESLLDINNPLRFIFSHSALREGWDNPNVFQICTLNETKSDIKKRQEIGRGLRLAVDQDGKRIRDENINRLTVIANESYDDFAKTLQQEIETDFGVDFSGRIKPKRDPKPLKYRKGFEADPQFLEIWNKIKQKTVYRVYYDTSNLVDLAAKAVSVLPSINAPVIRSTKMSINITSVGVETVYRGSKQASDFQPVWKIPDILGYIQDKTDLTRSTIKDILEKSGRMSDVLINPQLFLDQVSVVIKKTLYNLMIDGIKYHKIGNTEYEMTLFEAQELEFYLNKFTFTVNNANKTIYDGFIPLESVAENQFAHDCETSEQVKFYFKLPGWFKIPTPIGSYNPDWAVIFEDDQRIYFVAETKDTGTSQVDFAKLHESEQLKIKCGKAHFEQFSDVTYKVVKTVDQLTA